MTGPTPSAPWVMAVFDGAELLTRATALCHQHRGPGPAHWVVACPQAPDAAMLQALADSDPPVFPSCAAHEQAHWQATWRELAQSLARTGWGLLPGLHRLRLHARQSPSPTGARIEHGQPGTTELHLSLIVGDTLAESDWPRPAPPAVAGGASVLVVGSGLAGAACARALAERGFDVHVIDAGSMPAAGASGLPVGLVAPHSSPDDSLISRLSRAGVRAMREALQRHVRQDTDWGDSGVLERRLPGKTRKGGAPQSWSQHWPEAGASWTCAAADATDATQATDLWQAKGAWVRPAELVRALLAHPRIRWQGQTRVTHLRPPASTASCTDADGTPTLWQVHTDDGTCLPASQVVLACGPHTPRLLRASGLSDAGTPIQPLRGQLSWGLMAEVMHGAAHAPSSAHDLSHWPRTPINGNGSFVHSLDTPEGPAWFAGSTFDRTRDTPDLLDADHHDNFSRLQTLLPEVAQDLQATFDSGAVRAWAGVRCSVPDRLPMVGRVPHAPDGLWLCSALGSRGLSLSVLCGEVLAAQWTGEPPPVEAPLLHALSSERFAKRSKRVATRNPSLATRNDAPLP